MTVNSEQRLVFGNVLEDCKDSVFDIKPTYIITTFLYYRRPVTLIKNFIGAVREGGGAGTTPQSQVCPSSPTAPNEFFAKCNWTPSIKI